MRTACLVGVLYTLLVSVAPTVHAAASPDYPAAIVAYPYVIVDSATGHDTMVRLSNVSGSSVDVRCFWEDATPTCFGGKAGETCVPYPSACSGRCIGQSTFFSFSVHLEIRQPLAWAASEGSAAAIQPLRDPFVGALRCVAFDADGTPSDRNVLLGSATIRRQVGVGEPPDEAEYGAVGIKAIEGAVDDDDVLVLGGPDPEYEGCPAVTIVNHFFDRAVLFFDGVDADPRRVSTRLVISRCGQDIAADPQDVTLLVFDEFDDQVQLTVRVAPYQVLDLGSAEGTGRVFEIQSHGTLTGQTRLGAAPSRLLVIGLETYREEATGQVATAAFNTSGSGLAEQAEIFRLDVPTPPAVTPTSTRTATVPIPPTATLTSIPTVTETPAVTVTPTSQPRDCCAANGTAGCDDATCESCVCGIDNLCCDSLWDGACADIASRECQNTCLCPLPCTGDCDGDRIVQVNEVILGTNVALTRMPLNDCKAIDKDKDGLVSVDELVGSVENLIEGCR